MKASLQPSPSASSSSPSVDVWVSGSAPFPLKTSRGHISPVASSSSSPHLHHISSLSGRSPSFTPSSYSSAVLSSASSSSSSTFSSYTGLAGEIRCVLSSSSPSSSISAFYHPVFSPSSFDKIHSPCASSSSASSSSASPHSSSFLPLSPSLSSHSSLYSSSPLVTFPLIHGGRRGVAPFAVSLSSQETSLSITQGRDDEQKETPPSDLPCAPPTVLKNNEENERTAEIPSKEGDSCLLGERTEKIVKVSEDKRKQKEDTKMTGASGGGGASNEDEDEDGRVVKKRRKSSVRHEGIENLERGQEGSCVVPAKNRWLSLMDEGEKDKGHNENAREEGREGEKGKGGREGAKEGAVQDCSGVCTPENFFEYKKVVEKTADTESSGSGGGGSLLSGSRRTEKFVVGEDDVIKKGREIEESRHHCSSPPDRGRTAPSSTILGCLSSDVSHVRRKVEEASLSQVYLQSTSRSCPQGGPGFSNTSTTLQSSEESPSVRRSPSDFCSSECDSSSTSGSSSLPLLSVSSSVVASSGVCTPEEPQPPGVPTSSSSSSSSSFRGSLPPQGGAPSSAPPSQIDETSNSFQSGDISAVSQSSDAGLELTSGDVSSSCSRNHSFRVRVTKSKRRDRRHSRQKSLATSKAFEHSPSVPLSGEGEGLGSSKKGVKGEGISRSPSITKSLPACVVLGYGATMPDREISGTSLIGLINLGGGSCFLNAVLQCLANFQPLRDFYLQWSDTLPPREVLG
ncbi:ubiquitin carboxyl-terminal hydrolase, partial [Cystoisospora suis]